jgi:hypothetical protein
VTDVGHRWVDERNDGTDICACSFEAKGKDFQRHIDAAVAALADEIVDGTP